MSPLKKKSPWKRSVEPPAEDMGAKRVCTDEEKEEQFVDILSDQLVDIQVGNGEESIVIAVHKKLLCRKIPYFEKMFNSGFKEAVTNTASLPEESPESFGILMKWVYSGKLPSVKIIDLADEKQTISYSLVNLCRMLDKLCLFHLIDQAMTDYINQELKNGLFLSLDYMKLWYRGTQESSPLRKYVVYSLYYLLHGLSRSEQHFQIWPTSEVQKLLSEEGDLLLDYVNHARNQSRQNAAQDPRRLPMCTFHIHETDEECLVKK